MGDDVVGQVFRTVEQVVLGVEFGVGIAFPEGVYPLLGFLIEAGEIIGIPQGDPGILQELELGSDGLRGFGMAEGPVGGFGERQEMAEIDKGLLHAAVPELLIVAPGGPEHADILGQAGEFAGEALIHVLGDDIGDQIDELIGIEGAVLVILDFGGEVDGFSGGADDFELFIHRIEFQARQLVRR